MDFIFNMKLSNRKKCSVACKELKLKILLNVTRHRVTGFDSWSQRI